MLGLDHTSLSKRVALVEAIEMVGPRTHISSRCYAFGLQRGTISITVHFSVYL